MDYLFINGKFPQYSQTFVHDQINAIKLDNTNSTTVFARSLAPFRFERSAPECAEHLLYAKPFNMRAALRLAAGVVRHPRRVLKLLNLYRTGKIRYQTLMLAAQLRTVPDVAITHFGSNFQTGVELKRHVFPSMKNAVVFHGHDVSSYIRRNGWDNYRAASQFIDLAICVNKIWTEAIQSNTEIRDVRTIYLGTEYGPLTRKRNGDRDAFSILFVGRFVEKKGFDTLYQAMRNLRATTPQQFRVHCVGDGPDLEALKERARNDGLDQTLIFYGSKQKSFVTQLMRECDLLVAPSRVAKDGDSEGLPVVLMEAMVAGIPVLSTRHSGIPELIQHLQTGLLVDENNVVQLQEAIEYAVQTPDVMRRLSVRAHEYVREHHNEAVQTVKFTTALKELT